MPNLRYGSVCSGIEAATAAWHGLGWEPAWFSEIEPFPKAVLAHHYPSVPDLGDMTALPQRILSGEVEAPDVFVGGTPCQSFSVAGLRKGLTDPRGQLTRTFVEIIDAIDTVRLARGESPCVALWENVPGVLSDKDNAFGNFLGALVGEDCALEPPGGRWTDAGLVLGPTRQAAWRILDAQYFGVAQRRRRVFVVVSSRASGVHPVSVLLVEEGVRRDTPPSREAGQGAAAPAAGGAATGGGKVVAPPLTATNDPSRSPQSSEVTQQVEAVLRATYPELPHVVGTLSDGAHNGGGSTDRMPTLGASFPSVAMCLNAGSMGRRDAETETLLPVGGSFDPVALGFYPTEGREFPCFRELSPTVKVESGGSSGNPPGVCVTGDRTHALRAEGADASEDGTGRGTPIVTTPMCVFQDSQFGVQQYDSAGTLRAGRIPEHQMVVSATAAVAFDIKRGLAPHGAAAETEIANALAASDYKDQQLTRTAMQVRRLTPVECERLQGFPDGWTQIPWKGKSASECPDGPRYKALGNSMAVPVMRWIGDRINRAATPSREPGSRRLE